MPLVPARLPRLLMDAFLAPVPPPVPEHIPAGGVVQILESVQLVLGTIFANPMGRKWVALGW